MGISSTAQETNVHIKPHIQMLMTALPRTDQSWKQLCHRLGSEWKNITKDCGAEVQMMDHEPDGEGMC